MTVENSTPNRGYQLPFGSNDLADDVLRLIAALSAIDVDVAGMLVSIAQRALVVHSHVIADTTGLQAALDAKQDASERGNANGYAALGADGKVPAAQLPSALFGAMSYQTDWNANTNTPTIPAAAPANKGFYYIVAVAGATSVGGITDWKVGDWLVSDGTKWSKIDNTDAVSSVAGLVGAISTASLKSALAIAAADIVSGTLADARLPARLGLVCETIADWNAATANGWHMGAGAANAPDANWYIGQTITHIESLWLQQDLYGFTQATASESKHYRRYRVNGTFGAWFRVYENGGELDARYALLANVSMAALANAIAQRDTAGDITARLFRSEYTGTEGTFAYFCGQHAIGAGADNYLRPMTPTQAAALLVPSLAVARAWVNFDGTGTIAIRDSHNVSSITDNGTGAYTVNFASAMPNANYAVVAGMSITGTGNTSGGFGVVTRLDTPPTTAAVSIVARISNAVVDPSYCHVAIFGD
ncbi:hypothetical protein [Mesorhizobium sp. WSM4906]|uniref:hypothetical protein n=1 Tax=Mesorhizobium sp. WSM4906 TaxID=3038546 RepID=UPI002416F78D|nr:hypothetical protein [Mesorhizobium sp. WSM4906]WFP74494.1 hypothetical protein QAZ22_22480 [Mesorhizobium sp. WSM4906]